MLSDWTETTVIRLIPVDEEDGAAFKDNFQ